MAASIKTHAITNIYITIDTEASIAGCFANPNKFAPQLEQPVFGFVNNRSQGLGFILETLKQFGQVATFFTESLQARYFGNEPMARAAELIVSHHQDLQLHIHPCWTNFTDGRLISTKLNDHSTGRSIDELTDIFGEAVERFNDFGLSHPVAVRTGNFSTGLDTFKALRRVGLKASSNIAIDLAPPAERQLHLASGLHNIEGIIELPLTTFSSYSALGLPRRRSLAITACSFAEIKRVLTQAHHQHLGSVCILTHPFEFFSAKRSKITANTLTQGRFRQLCDYLQQNDDKFITSTFSELAKTTPDQLTAPKVTLNGSYPQALIRAGQNFLYDRLG